MKKALLTLLVVMMAVTSAFAATVNYGLDVHGVYSTTVQNDNAEELAMSFKPYVSGDDFKVQLRANWDLKRGFTPLKDFKKDNVFDMAASVAKYIDNAHFDIGEYVTFGFARDEYDEPFVYFKAEKDLNSFSLEVTQDTIKGINPDYDYVIPGSIDFLTTAKNEKFPIGFEAGTDFEYYFKSNDNMMYSLEPYAGVILPVIINDHRFNFEAKVSTTWAQKAQNEQFTVTQDLLKDWVIYTEAESEFGKLDVELWTELTKESKATSSFAFGGDFELTLKEGKINAGFELPFATQKDWGFMVEDGKSQDSYYASYEYGTWLYSGLSVEAVGVAKAVKNSVKLEDFFEPSNGYIEVGGFVGFKTKPFNLLLEAYFTDYKNKDADLKLTFDVNAENFFPSK